MSKTAFQKLLALVALDAALLVKRTELTGTQEKIDQEYRAIDELQKLAQSHKDAVLKAQKAVNSIEHEMKTIEQREQTKKKLIDSAHNLKEFNSAKAELAAVHHDILNQEQAIMNAWHELEAAQKTLQTFDTTYPARLEIIQKNIEMLSTTLAALTTEIMTLETQRPEIMQQVPEEWISQYKNMHATVPDPIVPTLDGACSACFAPIPSQFAGRIERGAILPCKSCFRLLYSPTAHPVETT